MAFAYDPNRQHVTWILGAGFSKSLGGPLLEDLLSAAACREFHSLAGSDANLKLLPRAANIYHFGRQYELGDPMPNFPTIEGQRLWSDAEEFLEILDLACRDTASQVSSAGRRLRLAWYGSERQPVTPIDEEYNERNLTGARDAVRRLVAWQCHRFVEEGDLRSERWAPYRRWVERIGGPNTVVSFNYDCVVEKCGGNRAVPVRPHELAKAYKSAREDGSSFRLFKLHGSTNWRINGSTVGQEWDEQTNSPLLVDSPVLGMPGPHKAELVNKELTELWDGACEAIRSSVAVLFLGYRFPPSDAMAREQLLEALRTNMKPFLDLHVVLGPNLNHPDVLRMQGLLDATMRRANRVRRPVRNERLPGIPLQYSLTLHPLFVEDFAATWDQPLLQIY